MNALMFLIVIGALVVLGTIAVVATKVVEARKYNYNEIKVERDLAKGQLDIAIQELRLIQRSGGENALNADLALDQINGLANKQITGGNR